jgi:hypothetical protein
VATLFIADELFRLAKQACERSESDSPEAVVALVLSAAVAFEAFLNEMVEFASSSSFDESEPEEVRAFAGILGDLEKQRAQIGLKVQIAHYILKKKRLNRGEPPCQDLISAMLWCIRSPRNGLG